MTYDANDGNGSFHCDTCPEAIATGESDFKLARIAARREGWKTYKGPDKQWAHSCPSCAAEYILEQQKKGRR